jgi:dTDP-4-dehydrorhamnose reductase
MITGASGQLGHALYRCLVNNNQYKLYLSRSSHADEYISSLDITEQAAVDAYVDECKPDIIINCAAMTAVDLCESEQDKAYRINALGPKYLALAAERNGAKLIHLSTDFVFDGNASQPYTEEDTPNPISIYGKTKQAGDEFVQQLCKKHFIIRNAWMYGEGKNFVGTMLRLAETNNKIRVVADQFGTPTSALEVAKVIIYLMETDEYGIYHATCEGFTSWYEFAVTIFKEAGIKVEVEPIPTSEYPSPAKRPAYSVLDNKALRERHGYIMPDWKKALHEYMVELCGIKETE